MIIFCKRIQINHLNTLWSTVFTNSISIPTLLQTSWLGLYTIVSFVRHYISVGNSIHTSQTFDLNIIHISSLCSYHTLSLCPMKCRWHNNYSLVCRYFSHLYQILYCSAYFSPLPTPCTPHLFCVQRYYHIHFTSSIGCYLQHQVLKTIYIL